MYVYIYIYFHIITYMNTQRLSCIYTYVYMIQSICVHVHFFWELLPGGPSAHLHEVHLLVSLVTSTASCQYLCSCRDTYNNVLYNCF